MRHNVNPYMWSFIIVGPNTLRRQKLRLPNRPKFVSIYAESRPAPNRAEFPLEFTNSISFHVF